MGILVQFKNLLIEALKDNKKLIIGLYLVFIVVFIAAFFISSDFVVKALSGIPASGETTGTGDFSAVELFIHNAVGGIVTYVGSIFFAIAAIVALLYNAVSLGAIGQLINQTTPNGGLIYITYLIPHGIFEITAMVLQSVAGVLLFLFIWRFIKAWRSSETQGFYDSFEKTKKVLIQSVVLMIFSMILLLIAAPIEAYVSVQLAGLLFGSP